MTIKYHNTEKECPICHGTGRLFTNETNKYGEEIVIRRTCWRCEGEGFIIARWYYRQKNYDMTTGENNDR